MDYIGDMKRHAALVNLSREHHHGLVLAGRCVRRQTSWAAVAEVFAAELEPHFRIEEERLLPLLGEDPVVARTLEDHAALRAQLAAEGSLVTFGERLRDHIRFEERELFERAQDLLSDAQLADALGT